MAKYLSANQIVSEYDYCLRTVRVLIDEIRQQISSGRYPDDSILEGCGVRINEAVFIDYLHNRKLLKDHTAAKFAPKYEGVKIC